MNYEQLLYGLATVLYWSLKIATPFITLILVLYLYEKYKKFVDKEKKESDRIIVRMAELTKEEQKIRDGIEDLKLEKISEARRLKKLKEERAQLQNILDGNEPNDNPDDLPDEDAEIPEDDELEVPKDDVIDYASMTIVELKKIAKEREIKGFSRMSKEALIKKLSI